MKLRPFLSRLLLASGLFAGLTRAEESATSPMTLLPASDSRFRYEGRFDRANPAQPVLIWAGDRISVDFEGDRLALCFGPGEGQTYFNATVDGVTEVVPGTPARFAWPHRLKAGRHQLLIVKRSEADAGHVAFRGVELAVEAEARSPAPVAYRLKLQFIGDSITAGANNEDGVADQWEDRRTHNHVLSYDFLTSQALGADHRAMAVSGMGICEGFVPMTAGETWDKIYPRPPSARADLQTWRPDVVGVNLGENDDAFSRGQGHPFPRGFSAGYVALIKAVRATWPDAQVVLLRGGMWGGKNSPNLRPAWEAAVKELEAGDPKISHYVFMHWSEHHPRVSDHRAMADELTAWLKQQPFMTPFLKSP